MNPIVSITSGNPEKRERCGTGFVIHTGAGGTYVLTTAGVVQELNGAGEVIVGGRRAAVLASGAQAGVDLAVLNVGTELGARTLNLRVGGRERTPFKSALARPGTRNALLEPFHGMLGEQVWLETTGQGIRVRGWRLMLDEAALPPMGWRGAPVLDENGKEVIGVVSEWQGDGRFGLALSVEALKTIWRNMPRGLLKPQAPVGGPRIAVPFSLAAIHGLVRDAFAPDELRRFCRNRPALRPVLDNFPINASMNDMIDALLEYCEKRVLLGDLLAGIREHNPDQYKQHVALLAARGEAAAPPPVPPAVHDEDAVGVHVVNQDLGLDHFVCVSPNILGWEVDAHIRSTLALPDVVSAVGGRVGLRFRYALLHAGSPVAAFVTLAESGVGEGSTLDLQVAVEQFGPATASIPVSYRSQKEQDELSARLKRRLIVDAFGHLWPRME